MLERAGSKAKHLVTRRRFVYVLSSVGAAVMAGENVMNLVNTQQAIDSFTPRIDAYVQEVATDQASRRATAAVPMPTWPTRAELDAKFERDRVEREELANARNLIADSFKSEINNLNEAKRGFIHNFAAFSLISSSFAVAAYNSKEKLWPVDSAKEMQTELGEGGSRLSFTLRRLKMRLFGPKISKGIRDSYKEIDSPPRQSADDFIV